MRHRRGNRAKKIGGDGSAPRERRFADSRHFFAVAAEAMRRMASAAAEKK